MVGVGGEKTEMTRRGPSTWHSLFSLRKEQRTFSTETTALEGAAEMDTAQRDACS
jgi:hypothetical protein